MASFDILRAERLSKQYGEGETALFALKDVSFTVQSGEFVVVLGPSGSGKSTLLNLLGGMDQPSEGRLWYRDTELTALNADRLSDYRRDTVGFVFQFFNLIPSLTALENVRLASSLVKDAADPREILDMVGLSGREKHFPAQLSGGEQQRVSIARALVKRPSLLLCDEPTGALDSQNGAAIVSLLTRIRSQLGCPVLTITHNTEMAKIADRVFHMKDGRLDRIVRNDPPMAVEDMVW